MNQAIAPWRMPAAEFAGSGGVTRQALGKPLEMMGQQSYGAKTQRQAFLVSCQPGCTRQSV